MQPILRPEKTRTEVPTNLRQANTDRPQTATVKNKNETPEKDTGSQPTGAACPDYFGNLHRSV